MNAEEKRGFVPLGDEGDVASLTECTGLIPALPRDDAEADSAAALYAIHRAKPEKPKYPTK